MDIQSLLSLSVSKNASDLHISAGLPPMMRIDGDLIAIDHPVIDQAAAKTLIYSSMGDELRDLFIQRWELDYGYSVPNLARFRVNAFMQNRGLGCAFRIIPENVMTLEMINAPPVFQDICRYPNGLVLVTGPTGSGKSSTLSALVNQINRQVPKHILTIEDPIEYIHIPKKSLINQREIHRDTRSFAAALRAGLREDPNIIQVGEMRDLETIRLALTAAETGHLVLSTVHTQSAAKTIDRIINVFPPDEQATIRTMLSGTLQAVISQVLLKKPGGGRTAAFEILISTPAIRNLIREDKVAQIYSAMQTGQSVGMQTLEQHIKQLQSQALII